MASVKTNFNTFQDEYFEFYMNNLTISTRLLSFEFLSDWFLITTFYDATHNVKIVTERLDVENHL